MVVLWLMRPTAPGDAGTSRNRSRRAPPAGRRRASTGGRPVQSTAGGRYQRHSANAAVAARGRRADEVRSNHPWRHHPVNPPVTPPDAGANRPSRRRSPAVFRRRADFGAEGRSDRALAAAEAGLRSDASNRDLIELVNGILNDAARVADSRRNDAVAANATSVRAVSRSGRLSLTRHHRAALAEVWRRVQGLARRPPTDTCRPSQSPRTHVDSRHRPSRLSVKEEPQRPPVLPSTGGPGHECGTERRARTTTAAARSTRATSQASSPSGSPGTDLQGNWPRGARAIRSAFRGHKSRALEALYPDLPEYRRKGLEDNKKSCQSMEIQL